MKKFLSIFMSAVLAITMVPALAFADTPTLQAGGGNGEFLLTMHRREALANTNFNITLKSTGSTGTKTATLTAGKNAEFAETLISDIANGTYELTITAPNYLTYKHMLDFDGRSVHIDLYNYQSANDGLNSDSKLGVMPAGDMNGDGKINDADADLVKNAIQKNNTKYDISGNGTVDLDDVAFVVRNAGETVAASPVHSISSKALKEASAVTAPSGSSTAIKGTTSDLFDQNKDANSVKLERSDSSNISASKPVTVDINTTVQQKSQALVIAPPASATGEVPDGAMSEGTVTVVGVDDKGNEVTITAPVSAATTKSSSSLQTANALASLAGDEGTDENGAEDEQGTEGQATDDQSAADQNADNEPNEAVNTEDNKAPETSAPAPATDETGSKNATNTTIDKADTVAKKSSITANGVSVENDGTVVIDLGTRVAIKKVTIRVTATANPSKLAEIAKVEFLSDFAERIPEPQLSIPTIKKVSNTNADGQGYKNITIEWTPQTNVTGYEVSISGPGYNKSALSTKTSHTFQGDSFNGTVKSFQTYSIKARSVSGDWRSQWSPVYSHFCTCTNKPPKPQYVSVSSLVGRLKVTWNCKFDAEWFSLFYRKKGTNAAYTEVPNITATNYIINSLQTNTHYEVYVVAHNRNGASGRSDLAEGRTLSSNLTRMPKFDLLNVNDADGMATTGIASVTGNSNKSYEIRSNGKSVNQSKATYSDWKAILDNNPDTYLYIPDWDSGVAYENFRGPKIQLAQRADVDTFRISPSDKVSAPAIFGAKIRYKNYSNNGTYANVNASVQVKYDEDNHKYYEIIADKPMYSDYFELRLRTFNTAPITIQELKVYKYNSLDHDIDAIFTDSMHTMIKDGVTESTVRNLIERSNMVDPVTDEMHPHHSSQMIELNYALDIIKNGAHEIEYVNPDNQVTSRGEPGSGMAQALSDLQPMGYVAATGDTVIVYVTDKNGKTARGARANLNLICTQMHPEVTAWMKSVELKAGRNEIVIPKVSSLAKERGGSLYLQYTGDKGFNNYQVRIVGATKIPTVNVSGLTGSDRTAALTKYVKELKTYSDSVLGLHNSLHKDSTNTNVNYTYNTKECILNYTDIVMNNMMYSFPASQVNSALGASSTDAERAQKLEKAIDGMETQIDYFYQFKGMNKTATDNDRYPKLRLNIRYHKMFTGAFMYAAGKHIGIEFGSVGESFGLTPVKVNAKGEPTEGRMSGWGIAHEIGHCINAAAYQRVEVTNNVYAQLAKGATSGETSAAFRANYTSVYNGIAAGNVHHNGNLKVQLAQYWQLHLAYDNNYAYKVFSNISEQQRGLFYARMESYLRTRSKLPKAFIGNPSGDQLFMQAACAAANKDILDYFRAWGYSPNADTVKYAALFTKETRKIQYINDDARLWKLQAKGRSSSNTQVVASITNAVNKRITSSNRVTISLANTNTVEGAMLGYEIKRNGKVVGFVQVPSNNGSTTFTDVLTTENNKAFEYEVTAFDKYLNATQTLKLDEVKVCHDGAISKANWTATSTTATSKQDSAFVGDADDPDAGSVDGNTLPGATESGAKNVIDNDLNTIFCAEGGGTPATRPNVVLNLGGMQQVTALKFTPAKKNTATGNTYSDKFTDNQMNRLRPYGYKIELSQDGSTWTTVKEGELYKSGYNMDSPTSWVANEDIIVNKDGGSVPENNSITIFFSKKDKDGKLLPYMNTYDAAYVRLTATNMSTFAASEIDILGPTSDNVELVAEGYGTVKTAFKYDANEPAIPAGARVLYGEYKGDPSYNIVLLKDQNNKVIDGQFIILANVTEKGMLGETSDGRWIFWMEDKVKTDSNGDRYNELEQFRNNVTKVKAELYRVDDAMTLAGQRLTSTSLSLELPTTLNQIELKSVQSAASSSKSAALDIENTAAKYAMHNGEGVDDNGNVVFDEESVIDPDAVLPTDESSASDSESGQHSDAVSVDGKYANADSSYSEGQAATITTAEAAEKASANEVANLFADTGNSIDVDQAELKSVSNGFTFKVNPSVISIASEGVFAFDPTLSTNVKIDVKGLTNAKADNLTYNGSYRDSEGKVHVFVIARTGILGNCVNSQTKLSFTGTISGLNTMVKGKAAYIRDIDGDYGAPTITTIGNNGVDFFGYRPAITSAKASQDGYAYTKKVVTPKFVVKAGTKTLKAGTDYTISYSGARKNIGSYKATITGIGAYSGTKTVTFKIVPKGTALKKATAKKKSISVSIKKQTVQTTGYKIRYSLKKNMSGAKISTLNKASKTSTVIKGLKSNKTYYVQVATYKKIGKNEFVSDWSSAKKVKVK